MEIIHVFIPISISASQGRIFVNFHPRYTNMFNVLILHCKSRLRKVKIGIFCDFNRGHHSAVRDAFFYFQKRVDKSSTAGSSINLFWTHSYLSVSFIASISLQLQIMHLMHWRIQGCGGRLLRTRALVQFLSVSSIFERISQNNNRLAPHFGVGTPLVWKILDPPLSWDSKILDGKFLEEYV